jgi:hypothetical protein
MTSTQNDNISLQMDARHTLDESSNALVIEEEVLIEQPKDVLLAANANVDPILFKVEPLSEPIQHYALDSDIQILSPRNDSVIVLDSSSEEDSMIKALEKDNSIYKDKFKMMLNAESQSTECSPQEELGSPSALPQGQPQSSESPSTKQGQLQSPAASALPQTRQESPSAIPQTSEPLQERQLAENNSLNQYELRVHRFEMDDRQNEGTSKRKNQTPPKGRPKKRTRRSTAPKLAYRDSEEHLDEKSPGRNIEKNLSFVNDENFSSSSEVAKAFTFYSNHTIRSLDNGASCFIIDLQRVTYKRDLIFEICIHVPQFSCYDVLIKDENIQHALNLNNIEWQTLKDNLNVIGEYEYINGHSTNNNKQSGYGISIVRQLDLYFSTLVKVKSFQIISNGHEFSTAPLSSVPLNLQTANAIDSDILRLMKK